MHCTKGDIYNLRPNIIQKIFPRLNICPGPNLAGGKGLKIHTNLKQYGFKILFREPALALRTQLEQVSFNFILLNRWYLGDFTKMEGTQMEMFNFLWLIWDHYLPLTPTC